MGDRSIEFIFIRHAESEDNVKIKALCEALLLLKSLSLPSWKQSLKIFSLLEFNLNSELSALGARQAIDMRMILDSQKFWNQEFDFLVFSPLVRAAKTTVTILPEGMYEKSVCLELLREITPFEQLIKSCVTKKMKEFETWVANTPTETKRILVVGHCQYFNSLLGMKTLMRNCDVWKATVTFPAVINSSPSSAGQPSQCVWSHPVLLHRTALSEPHPVGKLFQGALKGWGGWGPEETEQSTEGVDSSVHGQRGTAVDTNHDDDEVVNDLDADEPICRICQVRTLTSFMQ